tara:strand:- start:681 stop:920 length:240 start_codon:yes stop_codon:yes gene_type:complete
MNDSERVHLKMKNFETSHPNLICMWRDYIHLKKTAYFDSLRNCEEMMENLGSTQDITPQMLITLHFLLNNCFDLNRRHL